ncbi:MAG TPA: YicC/YloC family endoribonuclease [Salinimicrobium sp.]|nr:YicC/YloC family endoribonuclease [Salinimicrobium sp.]
MIQSMTGFGKSVVQLPSKKISVEIKSLNSKNLDLNARIPGQYREKELYLRNKISKSLTRGKVDFTVFIEVTGEETTAEINAAVVKKYISELKEISNSNGDDNIQFLDMALRLPDSMRTSREEFDAKEFSNVEAAVDQALKEINSFRSAEGAALEKELELRITNIKALLDEVIALDPERISQVKRRLEKGVSELRERVDENRFEQELIFYIEKLDITEEKVRLENHLNYFTENLNSEESNGKKLAFISQEMGREINTIGSKSNFAPMQQVVVQMKDELEKIKEQLLNIL